MRSQEEILIRVKATAPEDPLGFEWHEYLRALTEGSVRTLLGTLLRSDADLSEWTQRFYKDAVLREKCIEYMPFAWEKANGFRGISAGRSIAHYKAWLWLLGEDRFDAELEHYEFYGKDGLRKICEFLGLDADQWDDGVRRNSE